MDKNKLNEWKCEKPVIKNVEPLCLPNTRRELIPGYDFKTATNVGLQLKLPPGDYFEVYCYEHQSVSICNGLPVTNDETKYLK